MSEEIHKELERRVKAREIIAMAERLYVVDFEPMLLSPRFRVPTFTEAQAHAYLKDRTTFKRRWASFGSAQFAAA